MRNTIKQRIEDAPKGSVFITSDFTDAASVPAVNMALSRMAKICESSLPAPPPHRDLAH